MSEQQQKYKVGCAALFGFGVLALVVVNVATGLDSDADSPTFWDDESSRYSHQEIYSGQPIPRFTATDSEDLSQGLSEYEQQYGICFGWKLTDGASDSDRSSSDPESSYDRGSSRGPNTPVDVCDRWVELRATVAYTSSISDEWSAVELDVAESPDLSLATPGTPDFAELGMDAETFIESPVDATGHAALSLPLLLAEDNADFEVKQAESSGGTPQRSLPPADGGAQGVGRWIWTSLLGLATAVAVVFGVRGMRRERTAQSGQGPPPPSAGNAAQPPHPGGEQVQPPQQPPQNQWPGQQGPPQQPPQQWGPQQQGPPQQPPQAPPQQWGQPPQQPPGNPQWPPHPGPPGRGPQQ